MSRAGDHEFKFVVSGVELTKDEQQTVSSAVARAGTEALIRLKPAGPRLGYAHVIPKEWLGIWLKKLQPKDLDQIGFDEQIIR